MQCKALLDDGSKSSRNGDTIYASRNAYFIRTLAPQPPPPNHGHRNEHFQSRSESGKFHRTRLSEIRFFGREFLRTLSFPRWVWNSHSTGTIACIGYAGPAGASPYRRPGNPVFPYSVFHILYLY